MITLNVRASYDRPDVTGRSQEGHSKGRKGKHNCLSFVTRLVDFRTAFQIHFRYILISIFHHEFETDTFTRFGSSIYQKILLSENPLLNLKMVCCPLKDVERNLGSFVLPAVVHDVEKC